MTQLSFTNQSVWTITELTRYVRDLFEDDAKLQDVWVRGEVSNLSHPKSGHIYFTLKDSGSALRSVMWRYMVNQSGYIPRDGDAVQAHGSIGVYEAAGQYQLYVDIIQPEGEGALYQEFLRLKDKLESEGLFDQGRKRELPDLPQIIGVITSATGAALAFIQIAPQAFRFQPVPFPSLCSGRLISIQRSSTAPWSGW